MPGHRSGFTRTTPRTLGGTAGHHPVEVLNAGATDCFTKSVGLPELLARMRCLLRAAGGRARKARFDSARVCIDPEARIVILEGESVHLKRYEHSDDPASSGYFMTEPAVGYRLTGGAGPGEVK